MKFFQKKCVNVGLILVMTLPILIGHSISRAQSNDGVSQIKESTPILDDSYFKIDNQDFSVELGDKKTGNDNIVNFKAFPKKEVGSDLFSRWSDWATSQQKGLSFELIKATDQSNIETEIDQLNLEYSRENDQTGVAAQVGNFFSGLMDQFWNNIDGIANIGRKTNDLVFEETDNTTVVINQTGDKDISLEYQALENGLKENILVNAADGKVFDSYLYKLDLEPGVILHRAQSDTPFDLAAGTYYFTDEKNNYIAHFLPLVAFDSNGLETKNISMEILPAYGRVSNPPQRYTIVITIDKNWLTDSALQYPIRIDPTIIHDTKAEFDAGTLNRLEATSTNRTQLKQHELSADSSTVGLWHMNESTGQSVYDYGGQANNTGQLGSTTGSDTNDPTWNTTTQKFGASALSFDGTDDYVTMGDKDNFSFTDNKFTISFWMKANNTTSPIGIIGKRGSPWEYSIYASTGGTLIFNSWPSDGSTYVYPFLSTSYDTNWTNFVFTADGTTAYLYKNGQLVSSSTKTSANFSNTISNLEIGRGGDAGGMRYMNGSIDEVRISNRALSSEEIKADAQYHPYGVYTSSVMDLGSSNPTFNNFSWHEQGVRTSSLENDINATNLVAQWNFNETSGTTAASGGSCGASCNGTLNSFANTTSQDVTPLSGWTYENRLKYGADGDGSLMFDGVDDKIAIPYNSIQNITGDFSISAWIKTNKNSRQDVIARFNPASPWPGYAMVVSSDGSIGCWVGDNTNGYVNGVKKLGDSSWHLLTCTNTNGLVEVYVDGTLENSGSRNPSLNETSTGITIGNNSVPNGSFSGIIETPKIYSRALSADEINSNYQAGNIEFQTRTGSDNTPEDGGWEEWKSTATATETSVKNYDSLLSAIDPDPYTKLLLHMDGLNNSKTFKDYSGNEKSITVNGSSIISTTKNKFGGSSGYFDGTGNALYLNDSDDWAFADQNFTIDFWINYQNTVTVGHKYIFQSQDSSNNWYLTYSQGWQRLEFVQTLAGTNNINIVGGNWVPTANTWYHIALVRNNNNYSIYVNGVQSGTTQSDTDQIQNFAGNLNIAESYVGGLPAAYIDEFRISKGIARWNSNFTPSKYPFNTGANQISNTIDTIIKTEGTGSERCQIGQTQTDASTVLLWHLEETGGTGAYIKDSSGNGNNGTPTGSVVTNGISGKARSFNGNGEYINSTLNWTPTTYTVDWWIYPKTCTDYNQDILATNAWNAFGFAATSTCAVYVGTDVTSRFGPTELPANTLTLNQWQHFAYTYNGTQGNFYKNGQLIAGPKTQTASTAWGGFRIGTNVATTINGLVDEFRISNVARTPEEIAETYRMGANYHITRSLSTNIDLATTNNKLPIQIASDRPGTSLMLTAGESAYVNNELDANTVGLWHLEENFPSSQTTAKDCTDADPIGTSCGGGKKFAQGLVAMPSGCAYVTNEPTCSGGMDSQTRVWANAIGTNEPADSTTNGLSNTNNLYSTDPPVNETANFCHDLVKSGFSDWYLPAQSELITLASQSATIGGFISSIYWSSTEYNTSPYNYAYYVQFPGGTSTYYQKNTAIYYRCIRQYNGEQQKIKDSGPLNLSGQAVGTSPTQGKFGKGRYFNGTSDYIRIEDPNSLLESTSFTLDAWVKLNSLTDGTNSMRIAGKSGNDLSGNCGYGYTLFVENTNKFGLGTDPTGCGNSASIKGTTTPILGQWYHVVGTYDGTTSKIYVNGVLEGTMATPVFNDCPNHFSIGMQYSENLNQYYYLFNGVIDEVRYSNVVRSANEIRQAYESGLRSHPITIDFGAGLDSVNLIANSSDLSFSINATSKGLPTRGANLFVGDKIIVKENYNGTEYLAQGTVTSVNRLNGAVTVAGWDSGSTFPSIGYSYAADVFKWQKEYVSIGSSLADHRDNINKISLRILDGNQGQSVWLDDLKIATPLMTNPTTNTIQSTPNRYFQYRFIATTTDTDPTPSVDDVELDYSTLEITGASTSQSYINTNNNSAFNIQCNGTTDGTTGNNVDCEASFNQTNWYVVGSATSPLSNQTIQGTPDISSWTGYPSGDGSVTIYARAHNTINATYSTIRNFSVNKDVSRPAVTAITSVAGDTTALYSDGTDDSSTLVVYTASVDATACRWSATDQAYTVMTNTCTSTTNCTLNLSGKGQKDVYMACIDSAANISQPNYHLTYYIDVDPDIIAVDTGPSSSDRTSLTSDTWFDYADTGSDDQVSFSWTDPTSPSDDTFYYVLNSTSGSFIVNGSESGVLNTTNPYIDNIAISEGTSYMHVRAKNGVNSWGTERIFIVKYDKTNPIVSANNNSDIWRGSNITITLSTSDSLSDLNYSKYSWDSNDGTCRASGTSFNNNDTINIPTNGSHVLYLCNEDNVGGQGSWNGVYKLDATIPDIVAVDAGQSLIDRISLTSDNWFNYLQTGSDDQISFAWTDPASISDDTFYYVLNSTSGDFIINGSEEDVSTTANLYLDNVNINEGTSYMHVRAKNGADVWSVERMFVIKYDKTSPTVSANNNSDNWHGSNITITLSTTDSMSGINNSKYSWDSDDSTCRSSGTSFNNNDTINIISNGSHILYLCNEDNVNNQGSWNGVYKLDTSTPDIVTVDAGPSSTDRTSLTSDTWFDYVDTGSDDQISFSWTDPASPSDDNFYYLENDLSTNVFNQSGLVGWWNFENDSITTAFDHSGNGNDGTLSGGSSTTGILGAARNLVTNDYIGRSPAQSWDLTNNAITISSWIKSNDADGGTIVDLTGDMDFNNELIFLAYPGRIDLWNFPEFGNGYYARVTINILDNNWHHVVGEISGEGNTCDEFKIYVDGVLQTKSCIKLGASPTTLNWTVDRLLTIGNRALNHPQDDSERLNGIMDEVKIFNRTLTDTEVANEYRTRSTINSYIDNTNINEGTNYMHVRAKNGGDNWSTEKIFVAKYDKTYPTISATGASSVWRSNNIDITLYTNDNASGLNYSKYIWDNNDAACRSSGTAYNNNDEIGIVGNGTHNLHLCNQDNVGLNSSWHGTYKMNDVIPDVVEIDAGPSLADRTSFASGFWFNYLATGSDGKGSFSWHD